MRVYKARLQSFAHYIFAALLLTPIAVSPIMGDDLTAPFTIWNWTQGSVSQTLIPLDFGHHFNFIGAQISYFWNFTWILFGTEWWAGNHFEFYVVTKLMCFLLALMSINRLLKKTTRLKNPKMLTTLVFVALIQHHAIWSNDPVSNFPLAGYPVAALGIFSIVAINQSVVRRSWRAVVLASLILFFSVFYYELNLALLPVVAIHAYRSKIWTRIPWKQISWKIGMLISASFALLIMCSAYVMFQYISSHGSYPGTSINLDSRKILKTFVFQFYSLLPFANTYLGSEYISQSHLIYTAIIVVLGSCLCLPLIILANRNIGLSKKNRLLENKKKSRQKIQTQGIEPRSIATDLLVYLFFAFLIMSLVPKYQDEISQPGRVYMSFAIGHVVATCLILLSCFCLPKASAVHLQKIRQKIITLATVPVVVANLFFNHQLVSVLNERVSESKGLITAWDGGVADEICDALKAWAQGSWPEYYKVAMVEDLQETFRLSRGTDMCFPEISVK
jgi:hypothetical protein